GGLGLSGKAPNRHEQNGNKEALHDKLREGLNPWRNDIACQTKSPRICHPRAQVLSRTRSKRILQIITKLPARQSSFRCGRSGPRPADSGWSRCFAASPSAANSPARALAAPWELEASLAAMKSPNSDGNSDRKAGCRCHLGRRSGILARRV